MIAIVNPAAGRGWTTQRWQDVCHRLAAQGLHIETCETSAPGHSSALTRTAIERGFSTVVAVGGDGTIQEVVNGFMNRQGLAQTARLAVVPARTINDSMVESGRRTRARREACVFLRKDGSCVSLLPWAWF